MGKERNPSRSFARSTGGPVDGSRPRRRSASSSTGCGGAERGGAVSPREPRPELVLPLEQGVAGGGQEAAAGDTTREATAPEVQGLREENTRLKQVLAETVLENRLLKKSDGLRLGGRYVRLTT
jgi:hypothetical protein